MKIGIVQGIDRGFRLSFFNHLDEPKPSRAARLAIEYDLGTCHGPMLAKQLHEIVVRATPRKIADVDIHHRSTREHVDISFSVLSAASQYAEITDR